MGLTNDQRRRLSRKAENNSLEVEHLLHVAAIGDAADAPFLRSLKGSHAWSDTDRDGPNHVVPFGRWADTVCQFLEYGYDGLVELAKESTNTAKFCISVLENIKTPESVSALVAIGGPVIAQPKQNVRLAILIADALNLQLSFKCGPIIDASIEQQIRDFLHGLLALELSEVQRASAVCALRGVGDDSSVALIASLSPFRDSWAGLELSAVRQIKQRRRRNGGRG